MNNTITNEQLEEKVLANYSRIFALPADQITSALAAYWAELAADCTAEKPCAECLREMRLQESGGF